MVALCEQAYELAAPIPDYEEAAIQAGWRLVAFEETVCGLKGYWTRPIEADEPGNDSDPAGNPIVTADMAESACDYDDLEPLDREVYEHWAVTDWFADQLLEHGEKVDKDFAGMCVWARTTTGQAIYADDVIEAIAAALNRA